MMNSTDYHVAFALDAQEALSLFTGMRTAELLDIKAAHELDLAAASRPESLVFSAGRLELIAYVLEKRGIDSITTSDLRIALEESVKLQSHYAKLLNMHDGGRRIGFKDAQAWIARLRETGTLPKGPTA